jgi:Glycosyl transferases group 1
MLDWVRQQGITAPAEAHVFSYLFDSNLPAVGYKKPSRKLIFFGRLEVRKGLLVFLEALLQLDRSRIFADRVLEVIFLGKPGYTPDGGALQTLTKYRDRLSGAIQFITKTDLGHHQAMEFLKANRDALVVCPSLVDNSPYAVIECLQLGLNIIASNKGGIPELFQDSDRFFEPEPKALALKIEGGLKDKLPPPVKRYSAENSRRQWSVFLGKALSAMPRPDRTLEVRPTPPVSVFVSADGPDERLGQVLTLLESQTYQKYSVVVIRSQSTRPAPASFQRLEKHYASKGWSFVEAGSSPPEGPMASAVGATYAVFLSSGVLPGKWMLERLVEGMAVSGLDVLTCWAEVQPSGADTAGPTQTYQPLGPCLEAGLYCNLFGCGALIMNTAVLSWNGFELSRCDTLPETLVTLPVDSGTFAAGESVYADHMEVLASYVRTLPDWVSRVLVHSVGAEHRIESLQARIFAIEQEKERLESCAKYSPITTALKVKRETKRILRQIKALSPRISGRMLRFRFPFLK